MHQLQPLSYPCTSSRSLAWIMTLMGLGAACGAGIGADADTAARALSPLSAAESGTRPSYSGIYDQDDKWLCRPGLPGNPCTAKLTVAEYRPDGTAVRSELPATADDAPADCFYLYATVDPGLLSEPRNLDFPDIDRDTVTDLLYGQARPFRGLCNIYSPLYRQASLNTYQADDKTRQERLDYAYRDASEAFDYLLAHTDPQRPIILLSHSQGSHHTLRLLQQRFEGDSALRKRLVVAVLAGPLGAYWVPRGETTGGALAQIPLCSSAQETGCVLTFNTFLSTKPPDESYAEIGRALGAGDGDLGCTPGFYTSKTVRLRGAMLLTRSSALIPTTPLYPGVDRLNTDYARFADFYTGHCVPADNGLTYLSIAIAPLPGDRRLNPVDFNSIVFSDPGVGLHVLDYAFISGDLVADVSGKLGAFTRASGSAR